MPPATGGAGLSVGCSVSWCVGMPGHTPPSHPGPTVQWVQLGTNAAVAWQTAVRLGGRTRTPGCGRRAGRPATRAQAVLPPRLLQVPGRPPWEAGRGQWALQPSRSRGETFPSGSPWLNSHCTARPHGIEPTFLSRWSLTDGRVLHEPCAKRHMKRLHTAILLRVEIESKRSDSKSTLPSLPPPLMFTTKGGSAALRPRPEARQHMSCRWWDQSLHRPLTSSRLCLLFQHMLQHIRALATG